MKLLLTIVKRESFVLNNIEELSEIISKENPENVFIDEAQFFQQNF